MDPQATWQLLLSEWSDGDPLAAREAADYLHRWLERGGLLRRSCAHVEVSAELNCVMVHAVAKHVIDSVI